MHRRWQDRVIDWMNGLTLRIEGNIVRRRWRTAIACELIRMDAEDKIRRYEEAARRAAARLEDEEGATRHDE